MTILNWNSFCVSLSSILSLYGVNKTTFVHLSPGDGGLLIHPQVESKGFSNLELYYPGDLHLLRYEPRKERLN